MLCALTVRKLKPGTFEYFKAALRGGPIWPGDEAPPKFSEPAQKPPRWTRFYALHNAEDEDEVITFGFFEGSLDELRARQSKGGYGTRRSAADDFVESKTVDGVYEVLVERSIV